MLHWQHIHTSSWLVYYKDEGATYSFYKKTFPGSLFAASLIGWWVVFSYISTLALYAYTFASYAISGTLFGASRLMSVIAKDGYLPKFLTKRNNHIPVYAIVTMAVFAFLLVLMGGLELILEFGSVTFLLVSLLMACANYKIRNLTNSSPTLTIFAV